MCGRIGQFNAWQSYVDALDLVRETERILVGEHTPRYNVGPGTRPVIIDGDSSMRRIWWGFRPHWAVNRKIPQIINARGDKIESATWKPLLKTGRVIVPADCWYEWIKDEDGKKTPFLLRAKGGTPLFFAALTNVKQGKDSGPRSPEDGAGMVDGVVIVTDKSDQGMVDIHDRRPVALTADDAKLWLDPDTTVDLAASLARDAARPVKQFEWFKVSRAVNDARHDGPELVQPTED
jgi:putative SOS response-associated peptidase YedK